MFSVSYDSVILGSQVLLGKLTNYQNIVNVDLFGFFKTAYWFYIKKCIFMSCVVREKSDNQKLVTFLYQTRERFHLDPVFGATHVR